MDTNQEPTQEMKRRGRGFAGMDADRQRQIASLGGRASHQKGTAHEFTPDEARAAGRAAHARGNAHEFTPEEAREAGRKGGQARGANRHLQPQPMQQQ